MSGCDTAVEYVYQYIDDELTGTRKARVRWHLRRCTNCVDAYEFEKRLKVRVAEAGRAEPPAEFLAQIRKIVEEERCSGPSDC